MSVAVSEDHFRAFGRLICAHAQFEVAANKFLAAQLDINPKWATVLSDSYSWATLKSVIKCIASELNWDKVQLNRLSHLLGANSSSRTLRDFVAHSQWVVGRRTGSIKPIGLTTKQGRVRLYGHWPDERDWTAAEIEAEAEKVFTASEQFEDLARDLGIRDNIGRNIPQPDRDKLIAKGLISP